MKAFIAAVWILAATPVWALPPTLSAPEARAAQISGETVILDIRTPEEWAETGIAEGAWPVSMHSADFPVQLRAILQQYAPEDIALICATGGRSSFVAGMLERSGLGGIADISEGMMGNADAPGWIARGLPVQSVDEALRAFDAARSGWQ